MDSLLSADHPSFVSQWSWYPMPQALLSVLLPYFPHQSLWLAKARWVAFAEQALRSASICIHPHLLYRSPTWVERHGESRRGLGILFSKHAIIWPQGQCRYGSPSECTVFGMSAVFPKAKTSCSTLANVWGYSTTLQLRIMSLDPPLTANMEGLICSLVSTTACASKIDSFLEMTSGVGVSVCHIRGSFLLLREHMLRDSWHGQHM